MKKKFLPEAQSLFWLVFILSVFHIIPCHAVDITDTARNYWSGKKIVWFGTSIPAQGYPELVGELLGAKVINEAVGSSGARRGKRQTSKSDPYGWEGLAWQNVVRSLSQSLKEKQELIDNWKYWRTKFRNGNVAPEALSDSLKKEMLSWSWESKLNRYLGEGNRADLYVFDHGHNDFLAYLQNAEDMDILPEDTRNRNYFLGAMNFLIDKILQDNPRARICFIGHYENQKKSIISLGQKKLAAYWGFPLLDLWDRLGWSQQTVLTTGYWKDKYTWVAEGGPLSQKTMTQIWMQDNLHPASKQAKQLIAGVISEWMKGIR